MSSFIKRLRISNNETVSNTMSSPAIPYLAISMQLESSAREILDTFEHLEDTDLSSVENSLHESTSVALHLCKRKVLRPYFRLLSMLGWRPIIYPIAPQVTWYAKLFNVIYTSLVILLMIVGYVLQYASCFRQDGYPPYRSISDDKLIINSNHLTTVSAQNLGKFLNESNNQLFRSDSTSSPTHMTYKCSGNFISLYLIPDILHLFAYLFVFHLMRTPECECLQNLLERVFLQTSRTSGWFVAQKKLVQTLRTFLWVCVIWVLISVMGHTIHVLIFREICFTWMHPNSDLIIKIMIAFTIFSLTWNDIVCAAIVTSYSVHCQLNISYIRNLVSGVREKRIDFSEFSKRAEESRKFINYLNSEQALGVALLIINFGCRAIVAIFGLLSQQIDVMNDIKVAVMVLISSILWLSLLCVPVVQAIRLTNYCQDLRRIGHELRSRPFGYQEDNTPQEDLDSFLLFTSNIKMEAKMLNIPIRASGVVSILMVTTLIILFLGQINFVKF